MATLNVNGAQRTLKRRTTPLLWVRQLGPIWHQVRCGVAHRGACTVILTARFTRSCAASFHLQVQLKKSTIEGLSPKGQSAAKPGRA
jgi:isoquinoline 1-oxidoreductase alpha subunit